MRSGQPGVPSSHWTIVADHNYFYLFLIVFTIFHWILSAYLPPAEDEIYYWTWAKELHASYYDHPPMVAYLIAISTKIFGNSLFAIRFFAPIAAALSLLLLRTMVDRAQLLYYACLTPVFFWGSILMTPDVPLVLFWTLYLFWFLGIAQQLSNWSDDPVTRVYHPSPISAVNWIWGGMILGLGALSKYSMFLAVPCATLALFFRYRPSAWWRGFLLHGIVALAVASPILIFNWQHDFVSFRFQWGNAMESSGLSFSKFFQYLGSQILMVGALPFLMLPWILLWRPEIKDSPKQDALFYFFVPTLFFFLIQSFRTKLEANWGLVAYLSFWPLAQSLMDRSSFRLFGLVMRVGTFLLPILFSFALLIHLFSPLKLIPPEKDRITRFRKQLHLSKEIARELEQMPKRPMFLPNYQWTAYFKYQGVTAYQTFPSGRRSQFNLVPTDACRFDAIYFLNSEEDPGHAGPALQCFPIKKKIKTYQLEVRGTSVAQFYLYEYKKSP